MYGKFYQVKKLRALTGDKVIQIKTREYYFAQLRPHGPTRRIRI